MKKISVVFVLAACLFTACNNESETPAIMEDSAKVVPPAKAQDSMSLTDTNYRIGDTGR